jgi:hypothetical protein
MTYASEQDTDELIRIGKMPTALALAEQLEKTLQSPLHGKAADELRRLHTANIDCVNHFESMQAELVSIKQAITDPENQPSQFGTVTVDYMQRFMDAERQIVVDSLKRQAELAVDDFDRRWALEMAAAVAARRNK